MRAVSSSSQLWWGPALPTAMKVTWDARLDPLSRKDCQLRCEILVETADEALLAAIARQPSGAVDSYPRVQALPVNLEPPMVREHPIWIFAVSRQCLMQKWRLLLSIE